MHSCHTQPASSLSCASRAAGVQCSSAEIRAAVLYDRVYCIQLTHGVSISEAGHAVVWRWHVVSVHLSPPGMFQAMCCCACAPVVCLMHSLLANHLFLRGLCTHVLVRCTLDVLFVAACSLPGCTAQLQLSGPGRMRVFTKKVILGGMVLFLLCPGRRCTWNPCLLASVGCDSLLVVLVCTCMT
jgi:hypothetical protein